MNSVSLFSSNLTPDTRIAGGGILERKILESYNGTQRIHAEDRGDREAETERGRERKRDRQRETEKEQRERKKTKKGIRIILQRNPEDTC